MRARRSSADPETRCPGSVARIWPASVYSPSRASAAAHTTRRSTDAMTSADPPDADLKMGVNTVTPTTTRKPRPQRELWFPHTRALVPRQATMPIAVGTRTLAPRSRHLRSRVPNVQTIALPVIAPPSRRGVPSSTRAAQPTTTSDHETAASGAGRSRQFVRAIPLALPQ